jgi:cytochrome c-type biogenesis protein CcmH
MMGTTRVRRLTPVLLLAVAVVLSTGLLHGQSTARAKQLGGKLMCMCGCNEILTQCNHVGCKVSTAMLKELDQRIAAGDSDDLIQQEFVQEYGEQVLAEPPAKGFNILAWIIPWIAFGTGLVVVVVVIRHWRGRMTPSPAPARTVSPEMLERARRQADLETED